MLRNLIQLLSNWVIISSGLMLMSISFPIFQAKTEWRTSRSAAASESEHLHDGEYYSENVGGVDSLLKDHSINITNRSPTWRDTKTKFPVVINHLQLRCAEVIAVVRSRRTEENNRGRGFFAPSTICNFAL